MDYGPAIENLNYSTGRLMVDKPTKYPGTDIDVFNSDLTYQGVITMRRAIMGSRNTTAVQTFDEVGKENIMPFIKGLGIDYKNLEASNAISSNTSDVDGDKYGISSLKLAAAYAAFANNGIYNKPYYVNKVVFNDGTSVDYQPDGKRAMKDSTAYMMTDMLKDVLNGGTGFNGAIPGLIQAAKTGTSNYTDEDLARMGTTEKGIAPDSTFVGYTTHYAVSVWTGYNDRNTPIYQEYYGIASDVYREIMSYLSQNVSNDDWVQPDSVVRVGNELYVKDAYEVPNVQVLPSTTSSAPQPESSSTVESSSTKEAESSSSSSSESAPSSSEAPPSTQQPASSSSAEQPATSEQPPEPSSSSSQEPPQPPESSSKPDENKAA